MKTLAMATLIAGVITPAYAQETSYENAQSFITEYKDGSNIYARLYIRGVGEGLSWYNSLVDTEHMGKPAYCEPEHLALVDAQYVSMMRAFLTKYPNTKTMPVPLVLLYALERHLPVPMSWRRVIDSTAFLLAVGVAVWIRYVLESSCYLPIGWQ